MMKLSELSYGLKQGVKSIGQNRVFSLAAVGTITACLFLFGIFYFMVSNFEYMLGKMEKNVGVSVFFDQGTTDERIKQIGEEIKACKAVDSLEYISADQAWEDFSREISAGDASLTETFNGDNPLKDSASYIVYFEDISMQSQVVDYIEKLQGVREVYSSRTVEKGLSSVNTLIGYISVSVVGILLAVAVFLISTTVSMGISMRKREIHIMQLVGATDTFIKIPFVVEGIIIGALGAAIPLVLLHLLYEQVLLLVAENFPVLFDWGLTFLDAGRVFSVLTPVCMAVGVGIGIVGSIFTVNRHLR